jgi:serine/threonine protein phosphatase 1
MIFCGERFLTNGDIEPAAAAEKRFGLIDRLQRWLGRSETGETGPAGVEKDDLDRISPYLPPGRRIYCIGDIHGRLDLLEELHGMILKDCAGFDGSKAIVYLGDYIDRGAQSKQILDLLIDQPLTGFETVHLLGNHEHAMLDFLDNPSGVGAAWLSFGGQVTCLSYGVGLGKIMMNMDLELLCEELEEKLPQSHMDFLNSMPLSHTEGSYYFVHAGIRPDVPIEDQEVGDMLWIRDEFTRSRRRHEFIVVHGHTISMEVENLPNRIGLDTGAYQTGMLTALVLEDAEQRLLQTGRES